MFAEELAGNANKKRQEEARSRRRQLKQRQQRRAAPKTSSSFLKKDAASSAPPETAPSVSPATIQMTMAETAPKNAAVTNALQQRQARQESQLRIRSCVRIQSFYRAYRSNAKLLKDQAQILSQRLKDLMTLRVLLQQKSSVEYIPPPATASALVRQHLFLTKSIPYRRRSGAQTVVLRSHDDVVRMQQLIQFVVLPGLFGKDDNLDPLLPWLANPTRLITLIRVVLVVAVRSGLDASVSKTIDAFLRAVLGLGKQQARSGIVKECRFHLLPVTPLVQRNLGNQNEPPKNKAVLHKTLGSDLDLIQILRNYLLFSKGNPIPPDAAKIRSVNFTASDRSQADILFLLTLDAVGLSNDNNLCRLQVRFFTEILTVPLLSWRTTAKSTSGLITSKPKPVLLTLLDSVVKQHASTLTAGKIGTLLPSVNAPLDACPATPSQCLLANLVQVGRICFDLDYQDAAKFFNFLATLLDIVPLTTLSTARESAVEWISDGKSHMKAVVLSPVVLEQCKLLLVDSFVRELFRVATDDEALLTEKVLQLKTDKDSKHEKDLTTTTTAATLAAKEARIDRTRKFWKSSKWARGLTKGVANLLTGDGHKEEGKKRGGPGKLMNTTSLSRELAGGKTPKGKPAVASVGGEPAKKERRNGSANKAYDPVFLFALCRTYGIVLARWGGGGADDIVNRRPTEEPLRFREKDSTKTKATSRPDPCTLTLLNVLCFSTQLVKTTWAITQSNPGVIDNLYAIIGEQRGKTPIRLLTARPDWTPGAKESNGSSQLLVFLFCVAHTLIITDDIEIHDMDRPLPIHQIRRCIQLLKKLLYRACCVDVTDQDESASEYFGLALISSAAKTMRDLYDRSSRRPLCVPKLWIVEDLLDKEIRRCKTHSEYESLLSTPVLRVCPFLVSFKRRLKLFERIVTTDRIDIQGQHNNNPFSMDPGLKPGIPVRIMRGRVLEDGLATMNNLGKNMRQRIVVHYLNEAGAHEAGVDVGGLFKEFWTDLSALAFDPNYALFRVTEEAGNNMYPNPLSGTAHGPTHITLFEFVGRILGKALYEGITIHPQFAHFFLSFLRGDYNFLHMLPDLSTMDPQLYNNLMFLKTYDGDAEDLCLTFTITNDDFGGNREIPLIPNGSDVSVTNENKQRYIGLVAKYHVCDRVKEQSEAFTRGLWEVIDKAWLRIFNEPELQVLISGPSDGGLDVSDMRANTRYAGGFSGLDRTVARFWSVVSSFSSEHQSALLRFVTSCERPPPLGFASMNPPFTIQRVGILRDDDKLPTSSTCFNTLKLPTYSSEKVLRQRLIYAIESGAGFELS